MNAITRILPLALLLPACALLGDNDAVDEEVATLSADGLSLLRVEQGRGGLSITGEADRDEIEVVVTVFGPPGTSAAEHVDLRLEADGDVAFLDCDTDLKGAPRTIEVEILAPATLALQVHDGDGGMQITGFQAPVDVVDEAGDLSVGNHVGELFVRDGDGSLTLNSITGEVSVADEAGSLSISSIEGDVHVEDGDGALSVIGVVGDVDIEDGAGAIYVRDIAGAVRIWDGDGDIVVLEADSAVVEEDGGGAVDLQEREPAEG